MTPGVAWSAVCGAADPLVEALEAAVRHGGPARTRVVRRDPAAMWEVITGRLFAGVQHEYVGFDDPSVLGDNGMTEPMVVSASSAMREMLRRGVRVRQLTTAAGVAANSDVHPALQFRTGGEARVVPGLPWKACVFDRRVAVDPLDLSSLLGGMAISTDPLLVRMLLAAHRSGWDAGAEPVGRSSPRGRGTAGRRAPGRPGGASGGSVAPYLQQAGDRADGSPGRPIPVPSGSGTLPARMEHARAGMTSRRRDPDENSPSA
jgi:hypothetical protein